LEGFKKLQEKTKSGHERESASGLENLKSSIQECTECIYFKKILGLIILPNPSRLLRYSAKSEY